MGGGTIGMDLGLIMPWVVALNAIMTLGTAVYTVITSGAKTARAEIASLKEAIEADREKAREDRQKQGDAIVGRFGLVEQRLLKIESDLTHLPDRGQTHRLELAVERLTGRMETLDERLKPVAAISDRLQEFLLDQAGAKR